MVRRYRRYSRKRRYYRSKKKWTAYNTDAVLTPQYSPAANSHVEFGLNAIYGSSNSLAGNASAETALSAINYYACRCRFRGVLKSTASSGVSYLVYICYIPNAVAINDNSVLNTDLRSSYFYLHPEYVLAWTRLDYISGTGDTGEISLYSKITKRVSPGDRIGVYCLCINTTNEQITPSPVQGTFSCYLRTN